MFSVTLVSALNGSIWMVLVYSSFPTKKVEFFLWSLGFYDLFNCVLFQRKLLFVLSSSVLSSGVSFAYCVYCTIIVSKFAIAGLYKRRVEQTHLSIGYDFRSRAYKTVPFEMTVVSAANLLSIFTIWHQRKTATQLIIATGSATLKVFAATFCTTSELKCCKKSEY